MSNCVLCHKPYDAANSILEQRLVADSVFCNMCFTEFMVEEYDSNFQSTIR